MLTISGTAEFVGVSEATLRGRDAAGKFRARRHAMND
jgi:hypothetical protein